MSSKNPRTLHCKKSATIIEEMEGSFNSFIFTEDLKNGQCKTKGLCFKDRRVVFSEEKESQDSSYINASYIDGFKQPKAYIITKTPDSKATIHNFWKMIWEHQTEIIVMLNKPEGDEKGLIYWNLEVGSTLCCGKLKVKTVIVEPKYSFEQTKLLLTHEDGGSLFIDHFLFKSWPRVYTLPSSDDFYKLINAVTNKIPNGYNSQKVIHCSDGLNRSRVFVDVDISIYRIQKTNEVNFSSINSKLDHEVFNRSQHAWYYCFCYVVLMFYLTHSIKKE